MVFVGLCACSVHACAVAQCMTAICFGWLLQRACIVSIACRRHTCTPTIYDIVLMMGMWFAQGDFVLVGMHQIIVLVKREAELFHTLRIKQINGKMGKGKLLLELRMLRLADEQAKLRAAVEKEQEDVNIMSERNYRKFVRNCLRQRIETIKQVRRSAAYVLATPARWGSVSYQQPRPFFMTG